MTFFEISFVLLISILSFLAGRASLKLDKKEQNLIPENFFKGIDFLLNNRENEALKEFINAAKINSRNAEIYISLGNLYRKRGEVEKAIRIHRAVLIQSNIGEEIKKSTLINLARDFRVAGFFRRALNILDEYEKLDKKNIEVLYEKIKIFSFSNEREELLNLYKKNLKKLSKQDIINFSSIYTKIALDSFKNGNFFKANLFLKKALNLYNKNYFAYSILGDYYFIKNKFNKSKDAYIKALEINPFVIIKLRTRLNRLKIDLKNDFSFEHFIIQCLNIRKMIINDEIDAAKNFAIKLAIDNNKVNFLKNLILILELIEKRDFEQLKKARKILTFSFKCNICNIVIEKLHFQCPYCKNWLTFKYKE